MGCEDRDTVPGNGSTLCPALPAIRAEIEDEANERREGDRRVESMFRQLLEGVRADLNEDRADSRRRLSEIRDELHELRTESAADRRARARPMANLARLFFGAGGGAGIGAILWELLRWILSSH